MRVSQSFKLSFLVIVFNVLPSTSGADILVALFMPTISSHTKGLSAIAGALTRSDHNVTILTSSMAGTDGFKRDTYNTSVQYNLDGFPVTLQNEILSLAFEKSQLKKLKALGKAFSLMRISCESLFDDSETLALLKGSRFDIIIGDSFDACDALLSRYLDVPNIAVTTAARYPFFHEHLFGIPAPPSYVPFGLFPLPDKMTFRERILSFVEHHLVYRIMGWNHFKALNEIKEKRGIAPDRSVPDLIAEAELWLCMTTFALDYPHPTAPNWVAIGNVADRPAKFLDEEYSSFVEGSGEHGFIVFSLGTYFTKLPEPEMAEAFARVFSELPQRVIWRYTGTRPHYLGNNTMLVESYLPQNDLVGHPKARLLIYHGGLTGVLEAVYHAVPMVVMPIFAEQESNALRIVAKGMGRILDRNSISYKTIKAAVTEVLYNPRYAKNARNSSNMYRDIQSNPDETVVFWVEHILKFGGSHLRTRALELNFIQLHSIDVLAFIIVIVLVIMFIIFSCCKRCISCCLNRRKIKVE